MPPRSGVLAAGGLSSTNLIYRVDNGAILVTWFLNEVLEFVASFKESIFLDDFIDIRVMSFSSFL